MAAKIIHRISIYQSPSRFVNPDLFMTWLDEIGKDKWTLRSVVPVPDDPGHFMCFFTKGVKPKSGSL